MAFESMYLEEDIHIEKICGYPSEKDGECHSFDLCEPCYDKMTAEFVLKPEIKEETELLQKRKKKRKKKKLKKE